MTYRGRVQGGVVLLDEPVQLPEGAEVRVELVQRPETSKPREEGPTLYEQLRPVIGAAKGLPADLARNHDFYLHGRPKR